MQAYADPKDSEKNTIIAFVNPGFKVYKNDFIHVQGTVFGQYEGRNAFGAKLTLPVIKATAVEVVDYAQACAPALLSLNVGEKRDQYGYVIEVQKVELAKEETRVYLSITNNTNDEITFHKSKLVQASQQYEQESNYTADYPELQTDLLPTITTEGIITFPAIDPQAGNLQIFLKGSSDDWGISLRPFVFDISWQTSEQSNGQYARATKQQEVANPFAGKKYLARDDFDLVYSNPDR